MLLKASLVTEYTAPQPPQPGQLAAKACQPSKPPHFLREPVPSTLGRLAKVPLPVLRRAGMRHRQIALYQTPRLDFRMVTGLFACAIQSTVD